LFAAAGSTAGRRRGWEVRAPRVGEMRPFVVRCRAHAPSLRLGHGDPNGKTC